MLPTTSRDSSGASRTSSAWARRVGRSTGSATATAWTSTAFGCAGASPRACSSAARVTGPRRRRRTGGRPAPPVLQHRRAARRGDRRAARSLQRAPVRHREHPAASAPGHQGGRIPADLRRAGLRRRLRRRRSVLVPAPRGAAGRRWTLPQHGFPQLRRERDPPRDARPPAAQDLLGERRGHAAHRENLGRVVRPARRGGHHRPQGEVRRAARRALRIEERVPRAHARRLRGAGEIPPGAQRPGKPERNTAMTDTIRNLDDIATRYTVFEQDQVLTPAQLNSVSEYLGDQERLTRVGLLGVGIACGLWAGLDGNEVVLGHGVGATTDGDLVFLDEPTRYDRYKPYDRSAPVYPPFMRNDKMILAYELVRKGESDSRALVLSGFKAREGLELGSMAAVLYVESYLRDDDLCTGTDCDNRGKESMHTLRLLLVERESAAALAAALATPDRAARTPLDPV